MPFDEREATLAMNRAIEELNNRPLDLQQAAPPSAADVAARQTALDLAEQCAPVDTGEALPLRVATLRFIPEGRRECYVRTMDGGFRLAFIHEDDNHTLTAYTHQDAVMDELSKGRIRVISPGEGPVYQAAVQRRKDEMAALVTQQLDDMDRARAQARLADEKKKIDDEHARRVAQLTGEPK